LPTSAIASLLCFLDCVLGLCYLLASKQLTIQDLRTKLTGTPGIKSRRLESWKEIAAFLGRDVRTVIRWEKERKLPVHRDTSGPGRPTVYADTDELERWLLGHPEGTLSSRVEETVGMAARGNWRVRGAVLGLAVLTVAALGMFGLGATLKTDTQRHLRFTRLDFPAKYPMSVAVADFDRDGNPDIVFTNASGDSVDILFGDGNGSFGRRLSIPALEEPERLAVADFNGDGFPDIAVTYHSSHDVNVFLADGHGNFEESIRWPAGGRSRWITAADVNRDGIPDLIIACSDARKIAVGLGRGDGTFDRFWEYETDGEASAVIVGDFTHDNIPDILTADYRAAGGRTVSLYSGVGDGTFQRPRSFPAGFGPLAIAVADFNRDGSLDIATADYYDTVTVLLARGPGFQKTDTIHQGKANGFVATGDFDGDGNIDLIVVGEHSNDVRILFGDGQGNFRSSQSWETAAYPDSIAVADFDHDGRPDFVIGAVFGNQVSVYLNRTNH
jgi:hypothetical protein